MRTVKLLAAGSLALLAVASTTPASSQAFCSGVLGSTICGAGIGGGLGSAFGGRKGARTGAIIGGVLGFGSAVQAQGGYGYGPDYGYSGGGGYCNYEACSYAYRSFRPSDCSFQPYHGPRRSCAK